MRDVKIDTLGINSPGHPWHDQNDAITAARRATKWMRKHGWEGGGRGLERGQADGDA